MSTSSLCPVSSRPLLLRFCMLHAGDAAVQMDAAPPSAPSVAPAAAAFSEDTTPGDSPRSGDSAESTSFRCAICLVRRCPVIAVRPSCTTKVDAHVRKVACGTRCHLHCGTMCRLPLCSRTHTRHHVAGADVDAGGAELRPHLLRGVRVPGGGRARLDAAPGPGAPGCTGGVQLPCSHWCSSAWVTASAASTCTWPGTAGDTPGAFEQHTERVQSRLHRAFKPEMRCCCCSGAGGCAADGQVPQVPAAVRVPRGAGAARVWRRHPLQVRHTGPYPCNTDQRFCPHPKQL